MISCVAALTPETPSLSFHGLSDQQQSVNNVLYSYELTFQYLSLVPGVYI